MRLRDCATDRAHVHFALAEPGLFEVAFAAGSGPSVLEVSSVVREGEVDEDLPESDPYALLGLVLDELVEAGAVTAERREGAEALCWSAVHGFAVLHLHGSLRDVPAAEREQSLDQLLDQLRRGLV